MNLLRSIKRFCKLWKDFGFVTAFGLKAAPRLSGSQLPYHKAVVRYLRRNYKDLIEEYQHKDFVCVEGEISDDCPIWICWFQGEEQMPSIVKACFKTVMKHHGKHEVRLITMENLDNWLSIPSFIMNKVNTGQITLQLFSDYIRNALLVEYGGMWLDATLYLTDDLKGYPYPFYTIKQDRPADHVYVSEYRWTGFFLCALKGNPVNSFVKDMLSAYIQSEQSLIEYLLMDYIIVIGYETIPVIRRLIDNVPYSCPHLHDMHLEQPVDVDRLKEICNDTSIFKLTRGKSIPEDKRALYYYLLKNETIH